ncbi:MAG TPA: histidine kinase [Holophagaceae bacterium]|nr:histidine kinase [Holophagaceae bacterium]
MSRGSASTWRWPRIPLRVWGYFLLFSVVLSAWRGVTVALEMQTGGNPEPWTRPMLWELTGGVAGWAVLWIPLTTALNAPRPEGRWPRFLAIHLGGWLLYWGLKAYLMLTPRFLLYRAFGWGEYRYEDWPAHLAMEAMKDLLSYALIVAAYLMWRLWREREAERLRQAQLEAQLRDTQLRELTGQLDPHFLFNALNTVSSVMYEDLGRTDALLADLGQLLRAGLDRRGPTWSLQEEAAHLQRYTALLIARFGDRLTVAVDLGGAPGAAQVPRFSLQRLLENAVKHNQDRPEPLAVSISAKVDGGRLRLEVADDGAGFRDPASALAGDGHGLRGLAEALRLLHGEAASLELGEVPGGGAVVRLILPLEAA